MVKVTEQKTVLLKEIKENIDHFEQEAEKSRRNVMDMTERRDLLFKSLSHITSGAATQIVQSMIKELEDEMENQSKRFRYCINNKEYYEEIHKSLEKTED